MRHRGWQEIEDGQSFDFFWADPMWISTEMDLHHFQEHQRVNHFRNHLELTRKDQMIKNLKKFKKQLEREGRLEEASAYDFFPQSFYLPQEYGMWKEAFKATQAEGATWIMKPISKCQGQGIFLVTKLSQVATWREDRRFRSGADDEAPVEPYVCQRYIDRPYLVGGKKFDMRIYVLVTSFSPLNVYLFRSGFARFTFHRFTMDEGDIGDRFVHLTNVAIQKTAPDYDPNSGCKWDLRSLKLYLISRHGEERANKAFCDIQSLIIKTLLAVQPVIIQDKHCFEMYGYDVLLDESLKPWLLEVNASPSLTADTWMDYELKFTLLSDMLDIVNMERRGFIDPLHIGGFDLIYQNGRPVESPVHALCPSVLGTVNHLPRDPPHQIPSRYFPNAQAAQKAAEFVQLQRRAHPVVPSTTEISQQLPPGRGAATSFIPRNSSSLEKKPTLKPKSDSGEVIVRRATKPDR